MNIKTKPSLLIAIKTYPQFYQKVWLGCLRIPRGKTVTYGELAKQIGHPGAARAVGQALARNPFSPLVPCHRVIGANGKMVGYSAQGGVISKIKILRKEKAI